MFAWMSSTPHRPFRAFGNYLASLRKQAGYANAKEIAQASGFSEASWKRWESGATLPHRENLAKVAKSVGATDEDYRTLLKLAYQDSPSEEEEDRSIIAALHERWGKTYNLSTPEEQELMLVEYKNRVEVAEIRLRHARQAAQLADASLPEEKREESSISLSEPSPSAS